MSEASGDRSFLDTLSASAGLRPSALAVSIDGLERTYVELLAAAEQKARQLLSLGLSPGDRIGILLLNSVELLELFLGAAMVGIVTVPINTRFKAFELFHIVTDSEISALFTSDGIAGVVRFPELLREALPGLSAATNPWTLELPEAPSLKTIVTSGSASPGLVSLSDVGRFDGPLPAPPPSDHPLLLMYTSGTTAKPKGCIVSHRALLQNAEAIAERFEITPDDVWWCPLPMFHIGGLLFVVVMLTRAGHYLGMSHFTAEATFDLFDRIQPTVLYSLFPTITLALTDHQRFTDAHLSKLRYVFSVAPEDVQRAIQKSFPDALLLSAFGMTETCGTVAYNLVSHTIQQRVSSCGVPLPGWRVAIVDPATRAEVATDETGEIAVGGTGLFDGYYKDPVLTRKSFTDDGLFLTGDIGRVDADGLLYFLGRLKDQLKVGGENVSALEVESFLAGHPAVKLAQVVGVKDLKYGEVPAAFIETKAGQELSTQEILEFCGGKIARFKIPRYIRFVESWPMSATKILKFRLKAQIEAELEAQGELVSGPI